MADDTNDWRAERAAKLVGTPFERPRDTARSRIDDTLPIQRAATDVPSSTSAQPRVGTASAGAKPPLSTKPAASVRPRPSFALKGWGIAAAFVAALVGVFAYLLSGGLNGSADRGSPAKLPTVAYAAPVARPVLPQPAAPVAAPPQTSATQVATSVTSPALAAAETKPIAETKSEPSRVLPTAHADRPRVLIADRGTSTADGTAVHKRAAPMRSHNAATEHSATAPDRRSAVAERRPAAVEHRDEQPKNTVFATVRKAPVIAVSMPPCDLSNRAEAAVCASPALNALRRQVHDLYIGVGTDGDPKLIAKAQREQASFLKRRDRCKDNACLKRNYTHQVEALQKLRSKAATARVRAAVKTLPVCAPGQRPSPALCRPAHHRISLRKLLGIKHA